MHYINWFAHINSPSCFWDESPWWLISPVCCWGQFVKTSLSIFLYLYSSMMLVWAELVVFWRFPCSVWVLFPTSVLEMQFQVFHLRLSHASKCHVFQNFELRSGPYRKNFVCLNFKLGIETAIRNIFDNLFDAQLLLNLYSDVIPLNLYSDVIPSSVSESRCLEIKRPAYHMKSMHSVHWDLSIPKKYFQVKMSHYIFVCMLYLVIYFVII